MPTEIVMQTDWWLVAAVVFSGVLISGSVLLAFWAASEAVCDQLETVREWLETLGATPPESEYKEALETMARMGENGEDRPSGDA
jgi:hypothetical protein